MIEKDVSSINDKIRDGSVKIFSDNDIQERLVMDSGFDFSDVDIVTMGLEGSISGSAMMLLVPVAERGAFTRAEKIWLNGIRGYPGPAPNERLGVVDSLVFSDQKLDNRSEDYSGAALFKDIISNKEINVECQSIEGGKYYNKFTLSSIQFARMYVYNFFLPSIQDVKSNEQKKLAETIKTLRRGSRMLLNKAQGIIAGSGTRCTASAKALSITADLFEMDPQCMTKSNGENGIGMSNSVALAIPIVNEKIAEEIVTWIKFETHCKKNRKLNECKAGMADYLKQLIETKEFLFTESDMWL